MDIQSILKYILLIGNLLYGWMIFRKSCDINKTLKNFISCKQYYYKICVCATNTLTHQWTTWPKALFIWSCNTCFQVSFSPLSRIHSNSDTRTHTIMFYIYHKSSNNTQYLFKAFIKRNCSE